MAIWLPWGPFFQLDALARERHLPATLELVLGHLLGVGRYLPGVRAASDGLGVGHLAVIRPRSAPARDEPARSDAARDQCLFAFEPCRKRGHLITWTAEGPVRRRVWPWEPSLGPSTRSPPRNTGTRPPTTSSRRGGPPGRSPESRHSGEHPGRPGEEEEARALRRRARGRPGARRTRGRQEEGRGAREGERLLKVRQKAPVSLTVRNAFRARRRHAPKGVSASSRARKGRPRPRPGRAPARP